MSTFLFCYGDIEFGKVKSKDFLKSTVEPPVEGLEADTVSDLITEAHDEIGIFFSVNSNKILKIRAVVADDWWDLAIETLKALAHACAASGMKGTIFSVSENGDEGMSFQISSGKVHIENLSKSAAAESLDDVRVNELINALRQV